MLLKLVVERFNKIGLIFALLKNALYKGRAAYVSLRSS